MGGGICLSSLVSNYGSSEEALVVLWGPANHHSSLLASEAVVSRSLLDLVVDGPIALPLSRDLLRQPHFHHFHLGVSRLSLHAWRLSSDLHNPGVSPSM